MEKPIGTSMLFVNDKEELMLLLRDDIPNIRYPNCWDIVGGHHEEGETPEQTIIREVKEEIGIRIKNPKLFRMTNFDDRIEYTFWEKCNLDIKEINLQEGQMLKWFSREEIEKMPEEKIGFNFKSVILDFFKEKPYKLRN